MFLKLCSFKMKHQYFLRQKHISDNKQANMENKTKYNMIAHIVRKDEN